MNEVNSPLNMSPKNRAANRLEAIQTFLLQTSMFSPV